MPNYVESLLGRHEKIVLVTRQHWMMLVSEIILEIILIFLFFIGTVIGVILLPQYWLIMMLIGFGLILIPTLIMIRDILRFVNHQYIITNRRVIQIHGVYNKSITDSSLEKVNDVKMVQSVLGRFLGYGDIEILTASELGVNLFRRIENPIKFKTAMLDAKEQVEHEHGSSEESTDLTSLLDQLDQLHRSGILTDQEYSVKKEQILARF